MSKVILKNVQKCFDNVIAVDDFSLEISEQEFMVLVGPSGCGKSTVLKMIAGLEAVTDGDIFIGDQLANQVAPRDRDVAMVFQNYALYPHMNVFDNMAFGLKLKKTPKREIETRVQEAAKMLGIQDLLNRKPRALSGGQRQRVALGRAVVRVPRVYLFDEPLSNLDARLRMQMRLELKKLHEKMGRTSIYVTHDQIEAMTMGDRIAVMKDGRIQQVGAPLVLYLKPITRFVASFIGSPPMNFVAAHIEGDGDALIVTSRGLTFAIPRKKTASLGAYRGREVMLGIRPDDLYAAESIDEKGAVKALVSVVQPIGNQVYLDVVIGDHNVIASVSPQTRVRAHEEIILKARLENLHFFDPVSEKAIY